MSAVHDESCLEHGISLPVSYKQGQFTTRAPGRTSTLHMADRGELLQKESYGEPAAKEDHLPGEGLAERMRIVSGC